MCLFIYVLVTYFYIYKIHISLLFSLCNCVPFSFPHRCHLAPPSPHLPCPPPTCPPVAPAIVAAAAPAAVLSKGDGELPACSFKSLLECTKRKKVFTE